MVVQVLSRKLAKERRQIELGPHVQAGGEAIPSFLHVASEQDPLLERPGGEVEDEALSLAALANKPTLTLVEVLAILNGSVSGVEF